jgi:hypothetical protein
VKEVDHTEVMDRAQRVMAHATDVMARLDQKGGAAQQAARRERQRLNTGLGRTAARVAVAVVAVWIAAFVIGMVKPIGMTGFLIALLTTAVVAAIFLVRGGRGAVSAPAPAPDLPNGAMVDRFDSYIVRVRRALPALAQAQLDSISAVLPSLKQTLERVETLDPRAQDARRLMSIHLPGLIDRYANVPPAYRDESDGEGKTVDERLVESLAAARAALSEVSEQLARTDLAAFETQGRFIKSRYGEQGIESEDASST